MTTERAYRRFFLFSRRPKPPRLRLAPRSGKDDAQLIIAFTRIVATVAPTTTSGGSSADAVSSRGSVQSWSAGPSGDRSRDGRLEGPYLNPISSSSLPTIEYPSGREAQAQGHRAVAKSFHASSDSRPELHNSPMQLTSVFGRPIGLPHTLAADWDVVQAECASWIHAHTTRSEHRPPKHHRFAPTSSHTE